MSKFNYDAFGGGLDYFAVSQEKYTKKEAVEMAKIWFYGTSRTYFAITSTYVRHRAGINECGEPCVGWWIEYAYRPRSCPVWAFHTTNNKNEWCSKDYEYIPIKEETK